DAPHPRSHSFPTRRSSDLFVSKGLVRTIIGLVGDIDSFHHLNLRTLKGVADVHRISDPYKLVSRQHHPDRSTVWVGSATQVPIRSEEHTSELQSLRHLVCR